ncbi:MAG: rubredoxin [Alcanivorax sp.]|nr:rubredoxin [Alcanivorax sp.]
MDHRFECPNCGYIYDESKGDPGQGYPPGTHWAQIPDNWPCPDCAVREKIDFVLKKD